MRTTRFTWVHSVALFAMLSGALPAFSQSTDSQRWFRVELMIFSHESANAGSAERWDPAPPLAYPKTGRFLIDEAQIEKNQRAYPDGESSLDARGVQTINLALETAAASDIPRQQTVDSGTDNGAGQADTSVQQAPLTPAAFTPRPLSELEFRGKAAYMQRTGRFKTLFHQTWLQPMRSEEQALPIIIDRSGDQQSWPRLQGSVKFYLSRYLHIQTNLWLNTTGDYLPAQWTMPAPPMGPPSLIIIEPPSATSDNYYVSETAPSVDEAGMPMTVASGPVYPWRHAILMDQKRRMRSNEVHYIDHPMLGIVVKILPVSAEELEDIALADAEKEEAR
ncbi:MAG: CsiV family protein [Halieaceae bacterium]